MIFGIFILVAGVVVVSAIATAISIVLCVAMDACSHKRKPHEQDEHLL